MLQETRPSEIQLRADGRNCSILVDKFERLCNETERLTKNIAFLNRLCHFSLTLTGSRDINEMANLRLDLKVTL